MIKQAYINGFIRKCAESGVDPTQLTKFAFGMFDSPPAEIVGADSETVEKWLEARDKAIERRNKAIADRRLDRSANRSSPSFKPNINIGNWFNRNARKLSDAFADSWLVNNTGQFGKNLGFTYTPSAMVRTSRHRAMNTARNAWNSLHADPNTRGKLYSNEHARAANTIYQVMKSGKLPPNH